MSRPGDRNGGGGRPGRAEAAGARMASRGGTVEGGCAAREDGGA
ncbi:hypothetical protein ACIBK1_23225 [Microbispora rosea]|nr:hypothetical protein [Microbispora rosea]